MAHLLPTLRSVRLTPCKQHPRLGKRLGFVCARALRCFRFAGNVGRTEALMLVAAAVWLLFRHLQLTGGLTHEILWLRRTCCCVAHGLPLRAAIVRCRLKDVYETRLIKGWWRWQRWAGWTSWRSSSCRTIHLVGVTVFDAVAPLSHIQADGWIDALPFVRWAVVALTVAIRSRWFDQIARWRTSWANLWHAGEN